MTPTISALHSAHTEAALNGHRHYAAALRVMLERQVAELGLNKPVSTPASVLTLAEPETPAKAKETAPACPRCTSTETAQHRGECVHYKWCLDCSYQWDHC